MTIAYTGFGSRTTNTPQTEAIPNTNQQLNNTGIGFSFVVDDMTRFQRFLCLGSSSSTYYVNSRKLTRDNLDALERLLKAGRGKEVVEKIVEISEAGRGVSNDPALFALARCCACDVHGKVSYTRPEHTYELHRHDGKHDALFEKFPAEHISRGGRVSFTRRGDTIYKTVKAATQPVQVEHPEDIEVRRLAYAALSRVARTGTHLLHFMEYVKQFRGRGALHQKASKAYYTDMDSRKLAYQVLKYQQRDGWSQRDVLRLARPKPTDDEHSAIYRWITKGWEGVPEGSVPAEQALALIWAFERAKHLSDENDMASLVLAYKLPREAVSTQHLTSKKVWEALLADMPMEAMVRSLSTMTRNGTLVPMGEMTRLVCTRLRSQSALQKARVHPLKLLVALKTYQKGKSQRGDATWTPLREVIDALSDAFYLAFKTVEPSGRRQVLALDVSASMTWSEIGGLCITPREGSAAMALVTAAVEPNYTIMAFSGGIVPVDISPRQRLDDAIRSIERLPASYTDCSLPMTWAMKNNIQTDSFVIYTDNETNASNSVHPALALKNYRQKMGLPAKLVVVGMTATEFSIADPEDSGMLDVCGFDTAAPSLISSYIAGEF